VDAAWLLAPAVPLDAAEFVATPWALYPWLLVPAVPLDVVSTSVVPSE